MDMTNGPAAFTRNTGTGSWATTALQASAMQQTTKSMTLNMVSPGAVPSAVWKAVAGALALVLVAALAFTLWPRGYQVEGDPRQSIVFFRGFLGKIEQVVPCMAAVERAPERAVVGAPRRYRIVVLSDHGQSRGTPFRQLHEEALEELVRRLMESSGSVRGADSIDEGFGAINVALDETATSGGATGAGTVMNAIWFASLLPSWSCTVMATK